MLRSAILIVSDSTHRDPGSDRSGLVLRECLISAVEAGGRKWHVPLVQIVPDDVLEIQRWVLRWCDGGDEVVNLILTTGGTGFAGRDFTPEVRFFFFFFFLTNFIFFEGGD